MISILTLVLVFGQYENNIQLLLNDGSGNFNETDIDIPDTSYQTQSIKVVDITGNGSSFDIVVGTSDGYNKLLLNDRLASFTVHDLPGSGDTRDIAVGDLNGDGLTNVVVGNCGTASQSLLNSVSGAFTAKNITNQNDLCYYGTKIMVKVTDFVQDGHRLC